CGPELGIQLFFLPEELHGMGAGSFDLYRICERMGRIDVGVATALFATFLGSEPLFVGGTDEQKQKWLTRIADEGAMVAYGGTEPGAVSVAGTVGGQSPNQAEGVLGSTRLMVAAFALGAGWSALDRGMAYSLTRIQGGGPLQEKQGYTHKLIVPHAARLEAARAVVEE